MIEFYTLCVLLFNHRRWWNTPILRFFQLIGWSLRSNLQKDSLFENVWDKGGYHYKYNYLFSSPFSATTRTLKKRNKCMIITIGAV